MNWGGSFVVQDPAAPVAETSAEAWQDLDQDRVHDPGEPAGPFAVAAAVEVGEGRVFCLSDNAVHDGFVSSPDSPNDELVLAALRWLTEGVNHPGDVPQDPVALPADFNADGRVDFEDFLAFAGVFGSHPGDSDWDPRFDLDGSGRVDFEDFLRFAASFGR